MARDLGLRDRLIAHGVTVVEVNGWKTRGSTSFSPDGSVNHHTACAPPRAGRPVPATPSLGTCINGRPDVPGPLCNVLLGRDRKAYLIAAGRANHAGKGGVRGLVGNSKVYGLEIEHAGTTAEGIDPGSSTPPPGSTPPSPRAATSTRARSSSTTSGPAGRSTSARAATPPTGSASRSAATSARPPPRSSSGSR